MAETLRRSIETKIIYLLKSSSPFSRLLAEEYKFDCTTKGDSHFLILVIERTCNHVMFWSSHNLMHVIN